MKSQGQHPALILATPGRVVVEPASGAPTELDADWTTAPLDLLKPSVKAILAPWR